MATHDYVIDNSTGANVRADINNVLAAIVSNNSASSEPSTKYAYQWWADTNDGVLKIRNSANNAWITLLQLDGTLTLEDGSNSAPALGFRDDLNTGIFSSAADTLDITCGGTTRGSFSSSGLTVTGNVTATTFVGNIDAVDGDFDGTLEADAITVAGVALATVIAGTTLTQAAQTNITSIGTLTGLTLSGDMTFTGDSANVQFDKSDSALEFLDNAKAKFGTGDDLSIYHDASNSYIEDSGSGSLFIRGSDLILEDAGGNDYITCSDTGTGGTVTLKHNASTVFATASGGVSLTGGAAANVTALSDGSTITIDMATACHHSVTLAGNRTFAAPSNQAVGQSGSIFITQDGTGSRTASFNAAFKFVGGTAPTLTTGAGLTDRIDYIILSSNVIHCAVSLDVK
tara:strand:- start:7 stop:1209 length:1203 start_codon:yes stop_codon:yes gene_type:complete